MGGEMDSKKNVTCGETHARVRIALRERLFGVGKKFAADLRR